MVMALLAKIIIAVSGGNSVCTETTPLLLKLIAAIAVELEFQGNPLPMGLSKTGC